MISEPEPFESSPLHTNWEASNKMSKSLLIFQKKPLFSLLKKSCIKLFFYISRQLKIRIIEYDGSGFVDSERNPHEDFVVSRFIVHPNFNKKRLSDDIAVIILEKPIDLVSKQGMYC